MSAFFLLRHSLYASSAATRTSSAREETSNLLFGILIHRLAIRSFSSSFRFTICFNADETLAIR